MKYTNPYDISINCTPFFDSGCAFQKLQMYEEIGGSLAYGELWMMLDGKDESLNLAREQNTGTITLQKESEGGNIYTINFFITDRQILNNDFRISFVCVDKREFFTRLNIATWDTNQIPMKDIITSLYPGEVEFRDNVDSDVCNGVIFQQQRQTNHDFCTKLCSSFKHDIIFSFGWEKLLIKETISKDHFDKPEPYYIIYGNQEVSQVTDYIFDYNNLLYEEPRNPWEEWEGNEDNEALPDNTEYESKNCCCMRTYNEYRIMGRDHYQALQNRRFNLRYLDSDIFTDLVVVDTNMPNWKIGDVVYYYRRLSMNELAKLPFDTFLVKSNEVFFSADSTPYVDSNNLKFSWTTKLIGLKQSGTTLNREDPTVEGE